MITAQELRELYKEKDNIELKYWLDEIDKRLKLHIEDSRSTSMLVDIYERWNDIDYDKLLGNLKEELIKCGYSIDTVDMSRYIYKIPNLDNKVQAFIISW